MARKFTVVLTLLITLVLACGALGAGWVLSSEVERKALKVPRRGPPDLMIVAVTDSTITLRPTEATDRGIGDWRAPGLWGLAWAGGFARTDGIVRLTEDTVERSYARVLGAPTVGTMARLDTSPFAGDPLTALGLPFDTVTYGSDVGTMTAWKVAGPSKTWAIFVHGVGATQEEGLRLLPPLVRNGLPVLVIRYRNDAGVPRSPSGYYEYGASEWRDVEAAVRFALGEGAERIVLAGYSMGGGIVANFLLKSDLAGKVAGTILDSPELDFGDVITFGAERMHLPPPLIWLGKAIAERRFGFSWSDRNYLAKAAGLKTPILLFHGDADRLVNERTSAALATQRPDIVTFVTTPGATHIRSWNVDPARYEREVDAFVARLVN